MDIGSKCSYPASALSNFACHPFIIDDIQCNSMEGFLQSLKFKNEEMQREICLLVGYGAKKAGRNKKWFRDQTLYWKGKPYKRKSSEYQVILDRAYNALFQNDAFRKALYATKGCMITHTIGKIKESDTVLTQREFCSRLMYLRDFGEL